MAKNNIKKKWKTATCNEGAKCWCRLIVTEDYSKKTDKLENCIAHSGDLSKKEAQHIVEIHNKWLENEEKAKTTKKTKTKTGK
jgi:hypothetical protein